MLDRSGPSIRRCVLIQLVSIPPLPEPEHPAHPGRQRQTGWSPRSRRQCPCTAQATRAACGPIAGQHSRSALKFVPTNKTAQTGSKAGMATAPRRWPMPATCWPFRNRLVLGPGVRPSEVAGNGGARSRIFRRRDPLVKIGSNRMSTLPVSGRTAQSCTPWTFSIARLEFDSPMPWSPRIVPWRNRIRPA